MLLSNGDVKVILRNYLLELFVKLILLCVFDIYLIECDEEITSNYMCLFCDL